MHRFHGFTAIGFEVNVDALCFECFGVADAAFALDADDFVVQPLHIALCGVLQHLAFKVVYRPLLALQALNGLGVLAFKHKPIIVLANVPGPTMVGKVIKELHPPLTNLQAQRGVWLIPLVATVLLIRGHEQTPVGLANH